MRMLASALVVALVTACSAERPATDPDSASAPAATAPESRESPAAGPVSPSPALPDQDPTPGPGRVVAERFLGRYAADADACRQPTHETRLIIEPARISFYESSGPITEVRHGRDELSITAQLTGEGETREASYSFRLSDDGSTLVDIGNGMKRQRCI